MGRLVNGAMVVAFVFGLIVVTTSTGCYQRTIAPEISYDQDQVDRLEAEIEKLDEW